MSLTQDVAVEQYQLACDHLMNIAEDYNVSEEVAEVALAAAQELTLKFIDQTIEEIKALNRQYKAFLSRIEVAIADLEQTPIDQLLLDPLKQGLQTAKTKSFPPVVGANWTVRLTQFLKWWQQRRNKKPTLKL